MQDQPKIKPYRGSSFFADGLGSRPPVQGTIARGYLRSDKEFYTGKKSVLSVSSPSPAPAPTSTNAYPDDVETFPFPITKETVDRGRERYEIFCVVCHGLTGHGDGMVVRRGFRRAASFHDDRLRQAPVGHFFDAITNGWGAMPSYAAQIAVQDRWAIIAYVRALQLSQQNIKTQPGPGGTPLPQGTSQPQSQPTPATGGHQ
jgi:mono/diheme cytochrome c family protein